MAPNSAGGGLLDADKLVDMEVFALAPGAQARQALLASSSSSSSQAGGGGSAEGGHAGHSAITPGQVFLQGLAALQSWDLGTATQCVAALKQQLAEQEGQGGGHSRPPKAEDGSNEGARSVREYVAELEARCALASWGPDLEAPTRSQGHGPGHTGPDQACEWLKRTLGLQLDDMPPPPAAGQQASPVVSPGGGEGFAATPPARGQGQAPNRLDPREYTLASFLRRAQEAKGPVARLVAPPAIPHVLAQQAYAHSGAAGSAITISRLGLSREEWLELCSEAPCTSLIQRALDLGHTAAAAAAGDDTSRAAPPAPTQSPAAGGVNTTSSSTTEPGRWLTEVDSETASYGEGDTDMADVGQAAEGKVLVSPGWSVLQEMASLMQGMPDPVSQFGSSGLMMTAQELWELMSLVPYLRGHPAMQALLVRKLYKAEWGEEWEPNPLLAPLRERAALLTAAEEVVDRLASEGAPPASLLWLRLRIAAAKVRLALQTPAPPGISARGSTSSTSGGQASTSGVSLTCDLVAQLMEVSAGVMPPQVMRDPGHPVIPGLDDDQLVPGGLLRPSFVSAMVNAQGSKAGAVSEELGRSQHLDLGPLLPHVHVHELHTLLSRAFSTLVARADNPLAPGWGAQIKGKLGVGLEARLWYEGLLTHSPPLAGTTKEGPQQWAAQFTAAGGDLGSLQSGTELVLGPENPDRLGPQVVAGDATPQLHVVAKNVGSLEVKVYEIHAWNYLTATRADLDTSLPLEGLGPSHEVILDLSSHSPLERVRLAVDLPWVKGRRGAWIVELVGGGRTARALLRSGAMRMVSRSGPAGHLLTLLYEDNTRVPGARVWEGGKVYQADPSTGEVLLPYRPAHMGQAMSEGIVLGDGSGSFATLAGPSTGTPLMHLSESFAFHCGMHLDAESSSNPLAPCPLVINPSLALHGWRAPLSLIQDVRLVVVATDSEGVSKTTHLPGLALGDGTQPVALPIKLPDRAVSVAANLTGRVRLLSPGPDGEPAYQDVSASNSWSLGGPLTSSLSTLAPYLTVEPTESGGSQYVVEVLGRAGEKAPQGTTVIVQLLHGLLAAQHIPDLGDTRALLQPPPGAPSFRRREPSSDTSHHILSTDSRGRVELGPLTGITQVRVTIPLPPGTPATPHNIPLISGGEGGPLPLSCVTQATWQLGFGGPRLAGRTSGPLHLPPAVNLWASDTNAGSPAAPPPPPATPGAAGTDGTSVTLPYSCNPLDPRSLAVLVKYTRAQLAAASGSTAAPQTQPPANNDITPIILQGLIALEGLALIQEGGVRNAGPVQDLTLSHVTLVTSHTSAAPGTTDLEAAVSAVAASVCAVHVSGPLAPGRYNLILAGARHNMSINVLKPPLKPDPPPAATTPEPSSASAGGNRPSLALGPTSRLLLGATQLAEQVELQPLTIVSLTAVASEGVRLVVAGAPHELEGASAVITLSRFVPLTHAQAAQALSGSRVSGAWPGARRPVTWVEGRSPGSHLGALANAYESDRRMSDEARYVLDRRRAVAEGRVRPGVNLPRPSLLIHATQRGATHTRVQTAAQGESFKGGAPRMMMKSMAAPAAMMMRGAAMPHMAQHQFLAEKCMDQAYGFGGGGGLGGSVPLAPPVQQLTSLPTQFLPPGLVVVRPLKVSAAAQLQQQQALQPSQDSQSQTQSPAHGSGGVGGARVSAPLGHLATAELVLSPDQVAALLAEARAGATGKEAPVAATSGTAAAASLGQLAAGVDLLAAGLRLITVVVSSPSSGAASAAWAPVRPAHGASATQGLQEPPLVSSPLSRPFPPGAACVETRATTALPAGGTLVLTDPATSQLKLVATLPEAWALFGTLLQADSYGGQATHYGSFHSLGAWPSLGRGAKAKAYGQVACREMAWLMWAKDPGFFKAVIRPLLACKLPDERALLEDFILAAASDTGTGSAAVPSPSISWSSIAGTHGRPDRYACLTVLERVLLVLASWGAAVTADPHSSTQAVTAAVHSLRLLGGEVRAAAQREGRGGRERGRRRLETALAAGEDALAGGAPPPPPPPPLPSGPPGVPFAAAAPPPLPPGAGFGATMVAASMVPLGAPAPQPSRRASAGTAVAEGGFEDDEDFEMIESDDDDGDEGVESVSSEEQDRGKEAEASEEEAPKELGGREREDAEWAQRYKVAASAPVLFRPPQSTKQWGETGWYKAGPNVAPETICPPASLYWAGYADHLASALESFINAASGSSVTPAAGGAAQPLTLAGFLATGALSSYLPPRLHEGSRTLSDALLGLATLGLPWSVRGPASEYRSEPGSSALTLVARSPLIALTRQTRPAEAPSPPAQATLSAQGGSSAAAGAGGAARAPGTSGSSSSSSPVLILQTLIDPAQTRGGPHSRLLSTPSAGGDAFDDEEEEEEELTLAEVPASQPLLAGKVYGLQITVTSSSASPQTMDLTLQCPQGAVVLGGKPAIWTLHGVTLSPYGSRRLLMFFYFPHASPAGSTGFATYPAAASKKGGRLMATAMAATPTGGLPGSPIVVAKHLPPRSTLEGAGATAAPDLQALCSAPPSPANEAAILQYLRTAKGLAFEDIGLLCWRLRSSPAFFRSVTSELRARHMWPWRVWSYAAHHRDGSALRELLALPPAVSRLSALLGGPHGGAPPLAPGPFCLPAGQPLPPGGASGIQEEFWPLVNPRAHALGGRVKAVLNQQAAASWRGLLDAAARAPGGPTRVQLLQAAVHLVLQDRYEDAEALMQRASAAVTPDAAGNSSSVPEMQQAYLSLWLRLALTKQGMGATSAGGQSLQDVFTQGSAAATSCATRCGGEPRWRERWATLADCYKDVAAVLGGAPAPAPSGTAQPSGADSGSEGASTTTAVPGSLALSEGAGGALVLDVTGVSHVDVAAYVMDVELLFSSAAFTTVGGGMAGSDPSSSSSPSSSFSFVRPSHAARGIPVSSLPSTSAGTGTQPPSSSSSSRVRLDLGSLLPSLPPTASVMVEVSGGGLTAQRALFRCGLSVRPFESLGLVQVVEADTGRAVPAAYVKVYRRDSSGPTTSQGAFHKDGYTDLLGRFDIWAQTTHARLSVAQLAVLVSHPELGTTVVQVKPPAH